MPYFQQNLRNAQDIAKQPYQAYTGQRVAGVGASNPYSSNQYTDQMIQQVTGDISDRYANATQPSLMAQFNQGGAYGGSAHLQALQGAQQGLARELGNAATNIRYQNQDNLRQDWNAQLARQQAALDAQYGQYLDQRDYGSRNIDLMNRALGTITGGTSSTTGPNPNYTSAGQNAAGYAALLASLYGDD